MHQDLLRALPKVARETAERSWRVFPLIPGTKRPAITSWEQRATTDVDRIARCWAAGPFNVGIATGPSRLVVVDLDVPKHDRDLPVTDPGMTHGQASLVRLAEEQGQPYPGNTYTVRTGSGGAHLYFAAAAGAELRNTAGKIGALIDTRASGGYVVGAGSVVNGKPYTTVRDEPTGPLPTWLAKLLVPAPLPPQRPVLAALSSADHQDAYLRAAVNGELKRIAHARPATRNHPGNRNTTLYVAAVALGQLVAGGELDANEVRQWLTTAATGVGLDDGEALRTIDSGLRAGAKRPRTVARRAAA